MKKTIFTVSISQFTFRAFDLLTKGFSYFNTDVGYISAVFCKCFFITKVQQKRGKV